MKLDKYTEPDEKVLEIFTEMGGSDFDRMRTYLFELHRSMQNQKMMLKESHKAERILFPNAIEFTDSVYERDYENYDTHFVWLLLNSALITSYSLFEVIFQKVCFHAAMLQKIEIKKSHFRKGNITENCKKFIETKIGIDLSEIEDEWVKLALSQGLRNKIVHQSATIPAGNDQLIEHVKTNPHIHVEETFGNEETAFFIKDRLYIYDYITVSRSYLLYILIRVNENITGKTMNADLNKSKGFLNYYMPLVNEEMTAFGLTEITRVNEKFELNLMTHIGESVAHDVDEHIRTMAEEEAKDYIKSHIAIEILHSEESKMYHPKSWDDLERYEVNDLTILKLKSFYNGKFPVVNLSSKSNSE